MITGELWPYLMLKQKQFSRFEAQKNETTSYLRQHFRNKKGPAIVASPSFS
jgi:hypothetical protein